MKTFVCIKTTWSDDVVTISEPIEKWGFFGAKSILGTYADAEFWEGQIRPVRAILIPTLMPAASQYIEGQRQ